ncbi:MAG: S26 family signal peptidase [Sulfuritalea sp.]|nr:S26 family signal peptidase [Sulfuritalea sp.]
MAAYLAVSGSYMLAFNLTESLPGTVFVICKDTFPDSGEFVAFRWERNWPYPKGSIFVKRLVGLPGSRVTTQGRDFYVDGRAVGQAKERARTGEPLIPGPVGVIPEGSYYVAGGHPDSLDSRYQLTGWVKRNPGYRPCVSADMSGLKMPLVFCGCAVNVSARKFACCTC